MRRDAVAEFRALQTARSPLLCGMFLSSPCIICAVMLTLAISRGRIWEEALPLLTAAGVSPSEDALRTRQLVIPTAHSGVRLLMTRAQDAPVFVARGAAQAGIAGRDVLAERRMDEISCPLDLGVGRCRLVTAARPGFEPPAGRPLLVATKYPNLARSHFDRSGIAANMIKLHGAMELAPHVGLADMIVDLVDTGRTLRENGLEERETIMEVSALFVVNRAAARRDPAVRSLQQDLAAAVTERAAGARAASAA